MRKVVKTFTVHRITLLQITENKFERKPNTANNALLRSTLEAFEANGAMFTYRISQTLTSL